MDLDFPGGSDGQESACNEGDLGLIPGSGRSPGEGKGNPLQYSCLENPMHRRAWWATIHGVAKSWTRLSDTHTHTHTLQKKKQEYLLTMVFGGAREKENKTLLQNSSNKKQTP